MGFYARNFTYDNQSSESYNLEIANIDSGGGTSSNPGSGSVDIIEEYINRRPVPYFYGIRFSNRLEFPISFFSPDEIDAQSLSYIQAWLFGKLSYKQLAVIQSDMQDYYINCIFNNPQIIRSGNIIYGLGGTCVVDSQFGWTYPKTLTYNYATSSISEQIIFHNNSHYSGYNYPNISFTTGRYDPDASISITNATDNNRIFSFTDLSPSETITINNDFQIINSSLNIRRLSDFNKNFLRFVPGINVLSVVGNNITQLKITYQFARRIGG